MNQESGHRDAVSWEAIGLAAVAALRFLLPHAPDRIFDLDPASAPAAYAATGPGGAAFLDAVMLGIAAFALWREASRRLRSRFGVGVGVQTCSGELPRQAFK